MPRVPGLSLNTFELGFYVKARDRRDQGGFNANESWDVDSSNYDIEFLYLQSRFSSDTTPAVAAKYLGRFGRYLIEIRGYSRSVKSKSSFVAGASFGWAVHSPLGTVQWDYSAGAADGPIRSFRDAERDAILSLSLSEINDAFLTPPAPFGRKRLFDGKVL